jgi:hypothetical protein
VTRLIPSKSIDDIDLPETVWKPDFELGSRFQNICKELIKLSLLGITAYGFLIREIVLHGDNISMSIQALLARKGLMITAVVALGVSAGAALWAVKQNADCLEAQITIMRLLKRRHSHHWDEEQHAANETLLSNLRNWQHKNMIRNRIFLWTAVGSLVTGVGLTVTNFGIVLAHVIGTHKP